MFFSLLAFHYSLYFYLCTQLQRIGWKFSHWFLTSIYAVLRYVVHLLHKLTAYIEVYLYQKQNLKELSEDMDWIKYKGTQLYDLLLLLLLLIKIIRIMMH